MSDTDFSDMEAFMLIIAGWLTAGLGWFKWFHELREKRLERTAKVKAEEELKLIRRRADAPFLVANDDRFNLLYHEAGKGQLLGILLGDKHLLCFLRNEVEAEDGEMIFFLVMNTGESARAVSIKLDDELIALRQEADMNGAGGRQYLMYPYQKSKHGQEQKITLSFESANGVHDTHVYLTRHGFRILRRIDPALP